MKSQKHDATLEEHSIDPLGMIVAPSLGAKLQAWLFFSA